jgi:uncharacterized delta-60 repeat protein
MGSRGSKLVAALVAAILVGVALMAGMAAAATVGPDPSYGERGAVPLAEVVPPGLHPIANDELGTALMVPDGVLYAAGASTCVNQWEAGCEQFVAVRRYGPTGQLDPTYGQGGYVEIPAAQFVTPHGLSVDGRGRLYVVSQASGPGPFSISRYTPAGRPDPSFGKAGRVSVPAVSGGGLFSGLVASPNGQLTLVANSLGSSDPQSGTSVSQVTLVRLLPTGKPNGSFGKRGRMSFGSPGGARQVVGTKGNGVLVRGSSCCGGARYTPVYRVAASGRLDTRFDARERRAQVGLLAAFPHPSVEAVVARPDGGVDLLGSGEALGIGDGFVLRLTAAGDGDVAFGQKGVAPAKHAFVSGTAGSGGSTLALYELFPPYPEEGEPNAYVVRYLADGSPDPSFGGEAGIALQPGREGRLLGSSQGKVAIYVAGWRMCREVCPPRPFLTRLIEPAAPTAHRVSVDARRVPPAAGRLVVSARAAGKSTGTAGKTTGGGLDLSYGQGGKVTVTLPPTPNASIQEFVGASDGSVYALAGARSCGQVCTDSNYLYRYTASGALDTAFGSGGAVSLPAAAFGYGLGVDAQGRPLLAAVGTNAVVVSRYTTSGALDAGFGNGGSVTVACECGGGGTAWVMPARQNRILVQVQSHGPGAGESTWHGGPVTLTRLLADGSPDAGFGNGGSLSIQLGARAVPGKAAVMKKGAIVFGAAGCCTGSGAYLVRVSARGRVDTKFGRAAGRSLQQLRGSGELARFVALLPRSDGKLDVISNDPVKGGFDLRLKGNGTVAQFGWHGVKGFPFSANYAVSGANGAIFILGGPPTTYGYEEESPKAFRMLGNGRLDPAYGPGGLAVPLDGTGYSLAALAGGKALVMDSGDLFCRSGCPPTPGFARFLEGSARD